MAFPVPAPVGERRGCASEARTRELTASPALSVGTVRRRWIRGQGRPGWWRDGGRVFGGRWETWSVLALTSALAVGACWPAWAAPASTHVGGSGDPDVYLWCLAWFPYALGHGLNPLVTHLVRFPGGANLMWNTSMPLLGVLLAPLTAGLGPTVSYNLVATAGPALSAWVAYLALRRWVRPVPALAGALVFGFSPEVAAQSGGHPFATFLVTPPLVLILLDRLLVRQSTPAWRDGLWLGLVAVAQLLIWEELLVLEAVAAVLGMAALMLVAPRSVRSHLRHALVGLGVAGGVAVMLGAYPLAVQFLGPYRFSAPLHPLGVYVTDLWNFVSPTAATLVAPAAAVALSGHFTGAARMEMGSYVGVPMVAFLAVATWLGRRRRVTWVALALASGTALLSLGPALTVGGHRTGIPLPWRVVQGLPVLRDLLPVRFDAVMFLGVGLLVALGLEELSGRGLALRVPGVALAICGLVALVPAVPFPATAVATPQAFVNHSVCPSRQADVAILPVTKEAVLRWQEAAGFCFAMPAAWGFTGRASGQWHQPLPFLHAVAVQAASGGAMPAVDATARDQVAAELLDARAAELVVAPAPAGTLLPAFPPAAASRLEGWLASVLGTPPRRVDGVAIWPLTTDAAPAAGSGH